MSKVKYRVKEFVPTGQQSLGNHSFYVEAVINNEIDNAELASKIAARTGFKSYECQAVLAAIADVVSEELLASNRIILADERGLNFVSIYPKVSGSVSDADVLANPDKYEGATVAKEKFLTPDMLKWTVGATVGIKFSQEFAFRKHAQKVDLVSANSDSEEEEGGSDTPGGGGDTPGGGGTTPGGGGEPGGDGIE